MDFCGGLADIKAHILRTVGDPDVRFKEDALRILRALRFAGILGFTIEENTAKAMIENKALLSKISMERIREEFTRLLCGNYAKDVLLKFPMIIEEFIPDLTPLITCAQETPYHCYDVYEHTLVALMHIPPEPYLRITMFFHDFGKPKCKTIDANGTAHFKGHQRVGAEIVHPILKRLRYDNKMVERVTFLVSIHDLKAPRDKIEAKILLSKIGAEAYADLIKIKRADNRGKAKPHKIDQKLEVMQNLLSEILEKKECYSLSSLAVNGNDLKPFCENDGKKIKAGLDFLLDAVILENCTNEKEALLTYYQKNI